MKRLFFLCAAALTAACSGGGEPSEAYFGGEFYVSGDTVRIADCASGVTLLVAVDSEYDAAVRKYEELGPNPGERIFVEFKGELDPLPEGWPAVPRTVVIRDLIGFDRTAGCDPGFMLAGVYEASGANGKYLLRLKPDYTYTESFFPNNHGEIVSSGEWRKTGDLALDLRQDTPENGLTGFEIIPAQQTLVRNCGEGSRVYTKVYLR
ncbi:MAG: hypothetical protein IJC16_01175 [Rikenellaceae bacterium]|nr:hypothetical protein [Rikenellaceae bacterium]